MNRKILISPYGRALGVFTLFALMMINSSAALADEVTIGMSKEVAYILNSFMFLMCGVLVMWMAAGFAMLEAGFVRIHNTSVICLKNVALFAIAYLALLQLLQIISRPVYRIVAHIIAAQTPLSRIIMQTLHTF